MISRLDLGNFKAFDSTQKIPIKPITLIFGPNSAGKSSLIHGLLLAHEAMTSGILDIYSTKIGGESVDLGGFRQFVHRRDLDRKIEWGIEFNASYLNGKATKIFKDAKKILLNITLGVLEKNKAFSEKNLSIITYKIDIDGENLLNIKRGSDGKLKLVQLKYQHELFKNALEGMIQIATTTNSLTDDDYITINEASEKIFQNIIIESNYFLPVIKSANFNDENSLLPIGKDTRKQNIISVIEIFLPQLLKNIIDGTTGYLKEIFKNMKYLAPLRSYPQRHSVFETQFDPNLYSGGGYAWDVIKKDKNILLQVNEWLGDKNKLQTPYKLVVRELVSQNFNDELDDDIEPLKDAEIRELLLIDKRTRTIVSHRDVGVGISQILPVLVGAFANKRQIIAIEQPELHLHPALQAELGDVFIESSLGSKKNTFLLETHSEHLILRIMRRIRETTEGKLPDGIPRITPEDVSIIYVQPRGTSSIARVLRLDDEGQFIDPWPGGFFEEGFRERFS